MNTGARPNPASMARPAARTNGLSKSVIHGLPVCMRVTATSTVFGATFRAWASNSSPIFPGSWSGTSRMLTLAIAVAGITVLAPSPVKPASRPLTSNVGRPQSRSRVVNPVSPNSFGAPRSAR